jgi:predicted Zn-dependent protease
MKKKPVSAPRPQPAQTQAIERCLERGEVNEASNRLLRLQAAFPNFKPLKRLAFDIALESGSAPNIAAAAWDWCEASSNSAASFGALFDVSQGRYPYLFYHAAKRLRALGESVPDEVEEVRKVFDDSLSEEDGLQLDLSRAFMGAGRTKEARKFVETLDHPAARNNFAQILFGEGEVERAANVFASVLAKNPADNFALYRLAALRLWLSGKTAAADLNERLQAAAPIHPDDLRHQMESALFFEQATRADEIYRSAPDFPWYEESCKYEPEFLNDLHYLGAMAAWRLENHLEAIERLKMISEDDDSHDDIRRQCFLASVKKDTPDWALGKLSQWWPILKIQSFRAEKLKKNADLFDRWRVPMPHFDYLVAVAVNCGSQARHLALAALEYLADKDKDGDLCEEAKQTMLKLLRLPCGPDSVRSRLQASMIDGKLLDGETPVEIFLGGRLVTTRSLDITIMDGPTEEEAVLDANDAKRYEAALGFVAGGNPPRALEILEDLLNRYPDYPRILAATASLRRANDEPLERWAPLVRRAAEIEPDYFFSRIGMAQLLVAENRIEEARESLRPLLELKEMHRSEWRSLIGVQIDIAQAEGDFPAVLRFREMLGEVDYLRK